MSPTYRKIYRSVELGTRRPREQFHMTMSNLALVLAAALHTAGDIRAGASFQSGDWNGPLYDRLTGLRRMHFLHDAGKNTAREYKIIDFLLSLEVALRNTDLHC